MFPYIYILSIIRECSKASYPQSSNIPITVETEKYIPKASIAAPAGCVFPPPEVLVEVPLGAVTVTCWVTVFSCVSVTVCVGPDSSSDDVAICVLAVAELNKPDLLFDVEAQPHRSSSLVVLVCETAESVPEPPFLRHCWTVSHPLSNTFSHQLDRSLSV